MSWFKVIAVACQAKDALGLPPFQVALKLQSDDNKSLTFWELYDLTGFVA